MTTKHLHHIIPKHAGGTDEEENLILLSIEEHAEAHRLLYEKYGRWEDKIAWMGLSGMIDNGEAIKLAQSEGAKKALKNNGNPFTGVRTKTNFAENEEFKNIMCERSRSPEAIAKRKKTYSIIKHSQGQRNSQYGTMWITNGELNIKIKNIDPIPVGFRKGRVLKCK